MKRIPEGKKVYIRLFIISTAVLSFSFRNVPAENFDWRTAGGYNWNSAVKNQFGGTCWDFGPTACLEAKYKITRNDPNFIPDLSEQQNCWENNPDMGSTQGGGGFDIIGGYFVSHGDVSETEIPVNSNSAYWDTPPGGYPFLASGWESRVWKATSCQLNVANTTDVATNRALLKNAIKTAGPVFLDIDPSDLFNTVADLRASNYVYSPGGGHAVSLVGFYDDATCPNGGYWVIKNSWGTGTGESGYNYIPYGSSVESDYGQNTLGTVYYTGPMYHTGPWDGTGVDYTGNNATNTWKGTVSDVWNTIPAPATTGRTTERPGLHLGQPGTASRLQQYRFQPQAISVNGTVIAHGLTVSATGYSFAPTPIQQRSDDNRRRHHDHRRRLDQRPVYIGGPQSWNVAVRKDADR